MKHTISKIYLLGVIFALLVSNIPAQNAIKLTVTDMEATLARKMETNASALLTELNTAFSENRLPSFNRISGLSNDGKSSILAMWEMTPFRCTKTEIEERGCKTPNGWQIRNIPLFLKEMPEDEAYKEIAINFDNTGVIDDIYFALDTHNYEAIMNSEGNEITDLRRREAILNFVENFRTAYNRKDIDLLAKVYSDDALIITGKVVKQTKSAENVMKSYGIETEKIEYQVKTKKEYIAALRSVFANNPKINVIFKDIEVVQHPKYDEIYGVRLKQGWNTTYYSDIGWLFLMIDFKNGDNMMIHVRTWQPEILNGKQISEDDIFKLGDFDIRQ